MSRSSRRLLLSGAWLITLLSLVSWVERLGQAGLALQFRGEGGSLVAAYAHADLGTSRIEALLARGTRLGRAEWTGYWRVPKPGFSELVLKAEGASSVELDGQPALGIGANRMRDNRFVGSVTPGPHSVRIVYWPSADGRREIFLKGITPDGASVPLDRWSSSSSPPSLRDGVMRLLSRVLPLLALLVWTALLVPRVRDGELPKLVGKTPVVLLCLATLIAAGLRFEALVVQYWGVDAPDWAEALASQISALRPGAFEHTPTRHPYEGDPFSYLTIAKSMGDFYEPSAREPLFPALTRRALALAGGRDIGINFLSALSSTLVCLAIFALGTRLRSSWTGAIAAVLWAIEWQVISFSVEGWRDDLFTLEVVACAAALVSLQLKPSRLVAVALGVCGGLTLLTRLSALTFLVPGLFAAVLLPGPSPRRDRARAALGAGAGMLLLAGPFMAACAIGFGDPFYAVNVHAAFYRFRAGLSGSGGSTAIEFLAQSALPWEFLQTGFIGLTSYPFANKWAGLGAMVPPLAEFTRALAVLGLPILLFRPGGLLALLVLCSSIAPYAWTWGIPGGNEWRFTLPAYPFYLVSAVVAGEASVRGLIAMSKPESRRRALGGALRIAASGIVLFLAGLWTSRWLDWFRVSEAIQYRRPALIETGPRAGLFFSQGWRRTADADGGAVLTMSAPEARIRLPWTNDGGLRIVLRLGRVAAPLPVAVFQGEERLATIEGSSEVGEMRAIELAPARRGKSGVLELRFIAPSPMDDSALTLLWVRVEPRAS